jgi:hypothetical protein
MANPRPEKKPEPPTARVLPMQLQPGDRLADETGEWEVASRPFMSSGGKITSVRVKRVNQPHLTEIRLWSAHERISVKRASAEEGKQ